MEFDVGLGGAFLAGLASFLTPCILPIVPFYLCYMAGITMEEASSGDGNGGASRRKLLISSILFSAGVVTVFVLLGASASAFGQQFRAYFDYLKYAAALVLLLLGLHFLYLHLYYCMILHALQTLRFDFFDSFDYRLIYYCETFLNLIEYQKKLKI